MAQAYHSFIPESAHGLIKFPFGLDLGALPSTQDSWFPPLSIGIERYLGLLWVGVSFTIMTLIPKTAELIQGILSGKPLAYGSAIGEPLGKAKTLAAGGTSFAIANWERGNKGVQSVLGKTLRSVGFIK